MTSAPSVETVAKGVVSAGPFERCWWAFQEWLAHTLLILGIIGCIWLIDVGLRLAMHSNDPRFFDLLPVKWIFQAADCGVLVRLSIHGVRAALHAYHGRRRP